MAWTLWSVLQGLEDGSMSGIGGVTLEYRDIQPWMVWTLWSGLQGLDDASMSGRWCHSGVYGYTTMDGLNPLVNASRPGGCFNVW